MSVLVTMRVKVHDFEGTKQAAAKYAQAMKKAGCHWFKIYRAEKDPNNVLWLMEWESHSAFNAVGDETGEAVNTLVDPASDWDDVVWQLSDAVVLE